MLRAARKPPQDLPATEPLGTAAKALNPVLRQIVQNPHAIDFSTARRNHCRRPLHANPKLGRDILTGPGGDISIGVCKRSNTLVLVRI